MPSPWSSPTTEGQGFRISPRQLASAITPRTKAIILNSRITRQGPPTRLKNCGRSPGFWCRKKILIIADDIYEKFVYDGIAFTSIASLGKEIQDQTMVINGVSKTYSMTGWRDRFRSRAGRIIAEMGKVQTQNVSNPVSFCQKAAVEAWSARRIRLAR